MRLYFKTTELSYQHFAALFGKNHSGCSEKCKLRYQNASLYSTASFWRRVGIIHSAALLRVSHQGHHSRVRYFQVLTIGINFPSPEKNKKKTWLAFDCNETSLWYNAYRSTLKFPSWAVHKTHKVISGFLSLFSSNINLSWAQLHQQFPRFP